MKSFRAGLMSLALIFAAAPAFADVYVPYQEGDTATFVNTRFGGETTLEILRTSGNWKRYSNFAGLGELWVWSHPDANRSYVYSSAIGNYQLLADFDGRVGAVNRIDVGSCNQGTATLAGFETVTVPAGTFADCALLTLTGNCADGGVGTIWLAPGVGVVKWAEGNIIGTVSHELSSASIGGVAYPKPSGITVEASFPTSSTFINMQPGIIGTPRPAKTLNLKLKVTNNTDRELTYTFGSGQGFEIELIDAKGKVVSRWSRGRFFTLALVQRSLAPGESMSFGGEVELTDDQGAALPEGAYTMRIYAATLSSAFNSDHAEGADPLGARAPLRISYAF